MILWLIIYISLIDSLIPNHFVSSDRLMVYLDRYHLKTANQQSLTETSLNIFRKEIYKKKLV